MGCERASPDDEGCVAMALLKKVGTEFVPITFCLRSGQLLILRAPFMECITMAASLSPEWCFREPAGQKLLQGGGVTGA